MNSFVRPVTLLGPLAFLSVNVFASELSYTFLDFESFDQSVDISGMQQPVANQTVLVDSEDADGIGIAGSLGLGDRFFLSGQFTSSIVDVSGLIVSPLTEVAITDTYDLITSRLSLGYIQPVGEKLDFLFDVSYDGRQLDFGSLAGENFDVDDTGVGAGVGLRWNPVRPLEIFALARTSSIAEVVLDSLETDSDFTFRAGFRWYLFEDLGLGLDYESAQTDTLAFSLRFSFGTLEW